MVESANSESRREAGPAAILIALTTMLFADVLLGIANIIEVEGRTADSIVTNIGYQGVRVPPGRHRVEMIHRNRVMEAGVVISASALILLVIAIIRSRRTPFAVA